MAVGLVKLYKEQANGSAVARQREECEYFDKNKLFSTPAYFNMAIIKINKIL